MYSDSVCLLVKCLLGLPIASELHGSAAEAEPGCGSLHGAPAGGFSMRTALILGTILAIGSYLTFIVGLSLQFQVWPTFISG